MEETRTIRFCCLECNKELAERTDRTDAPFLPVRGAPLFHIFFSDARKPVAAICLDCLIAYYVNNKKMEIAELRNLFDN